MKQQTLTSKIEKALEANATVATKQVALDALDSFMEDEYQAIEERVEALKYYTMIIGQNLTPDYFYGQTGISFLNEHLLAISE